MSSKSSWDWEVGKREVLDIAAAGQEFEWLEEPSVSPDGERIAAVANLGPAEFGLLVNGQALEQVYEKIWYVRFTPDGRLTAVVSRDGEWTLSLEGEPWPEWYGFVWNVLWSPGSDSLAAAVQQDMAYGMALNGETWPTLYENANHFTLSPDGRRTAAVVQADSMPTADIAAFQEGMYSVAINGEPWEARYLNIYTPVFSPLDDRIAAQVRLNLYEYTITVDGKTWPSRYSAIWEPVFNPGTGAVTAPVREAGKWGLAQDGQTLWEPTYIQCWQHTFSDDGRTAAAIVAPEYGRFTVAVNNKPWSFRFDVVTDLVMTPDGAHVAALGKSGRNWTVIVDGLSWSSKFSRVWPAVFSPDGRLAAAKVERNDRYTVAVNGKTAAEDFDMVWAPVFSPEGDKVLIRGVQNGKYHRLVKAVGEF